ncbi:YaaR family protein [Anaerobacillus sp. CMMVII]|uniref:YaaR family protein n=1 Tax=Anaerobacillus sp. CMMVII TaxID=2755588 RepID=UPI0021B7AFBF|nr:YaaR family protein [Anaerobacillus sp. CMMVII]MCT8138746.1 YaaR family protein [Anaerobacillus sp. CMMVII]
MDVQRVGRTGINKPEAKKAAPQASTSFTEVMQRGRDEQAYAKLDKLMRDIDDQGKVLADFRSVDELRKYKALVKEFMEDAVKLGLSLEERRGFNRRGRTKVYKIVKEVDRKLLELTDAVLKKEKSGLEILDMVGEIKGLIVNVYA